MTATRFVLFLGATIIADAILPNGAAATAEKSRQAAYQQVVKKIFEEQNDSLEGKEVYGSKRQIPAGTSVSVPGGALAAQGFDAWLFFVDDYPDANWHHPVRYVFVDTASNDIATEKHDLPPHYEDFERLTSSGPAAPGALFDFTDTSHMSSGSNGYFLPANKFAVILSGGGSKNSNHVRYWNDCSAVYQLLTKVYDFPEDNIYVLFADGRDPADDLRYMDGTYGSSNPDLDNDGDDDIQYAATKDNIGLVFDTLAARMSFSDFLFVFTTGHGGGFGNYASYLDLWGGESIRDFAFAEELDKVMPGETAIVMEQCYSGGFVDDLVGPYRTIATAARHDEPSYMRADGQYNEFAFHWMAAMLGAEPDGRLVAADRNGDHIVSMYEAFHYAQSSDTRDEEPQFASQPYATGQTGTL